MPIAWEFNPDLVLISAGFDAAIRDPLVRGTTDRSSVTTRRRADATSRRADTAFSPTC